MVMWRRDCEFCQPDHWSIGDQAHEYVHGLMDAPQAEHDAECADLESRIEELERDLMDAHAQVDDMQLELDQNEDEMERLRNIIESMKAGTAP